MALIGFRNVGQPGWRYRLKLVNKCPLHQNKRNNTIMSRQARNVEGLTSCLPAIPSLYLHPSIEIHIWHNSLALCSRSFYVKLVTTGPLKHWKWNHHALLKFHIRWYLWVCGVQKIWKLKISDEGFLIFPIFWRKKIEKNLEKNFQFFFFY